MDLEKLFETRVEVEFNYLEVLKHIESLDSCDDCRVFVKGVIMERLENNVDDFIQEKFNDGTLFFRRGRIETRAQPTGILIGASEAKKRSEGFEENYSANKSNRVKEAIGIALKKIDLNIKLNTGQGLRGVSCISNEEIREELTLILIEHGYNVASRIIGHDRVKFTINW